MIRNLTILGLALAAVLAMAGAAAASATAAEFNAGEGTTSAKGSQTEASKFKTKNGSIECPNGTFRGMLTEGRHTSIETSAGEGKQGIEYSGCKFLGFVGFAINFHECQYRFHANGEVDIVATGEGKAECESRGITYEAAGCKTSIPPQNGAGTASYSNTVLEGKEAIIVQPNLTSITYTASGCPSFNGTASDGEYTKGKVLVGGSTGTPGFATNFKFE
jgi:hypothetical protein